MTEMERFPRITGTTLEGENVVIPDNFLGQRMVYLIGLTEPSRHDVGKWETALEALDPALRPRVIVIPVYTGMFARLESHFVNAGMRAGTPREQWKQVVTIAEGSSDFIQKLGLKKDDLAKVFLVDENGRVMYHTDEGYSNDRLERMKRALEERSGK